eukprot:CAMPEP_0204170480 /NCGR_PEP_ID=MMETSP0361-20130328/42423_1 /ASSEMBLY_ACC=CAM_ASM_000343 /TAXON_ID=268821 /ORGANISM="Scrippsiella Hangoei, Strain SHTV-5" /LENGTH=61 /DNA_ID=CAMNT_0051128221 /DNA_START=66 /DNA_END=247 /DNA_ORIENTATION=-
MNGPVEDAGAQGGGATAIPMSVDTRRNARRPRSSRSPRAQSAVALGGTQTKRTADKALRRG